jgi:hypothetical protein
MNNNISSQIKKHRNTKNHDILQCYTRSWLGIGTTTWLIKNHQLRNNSTVFEELEVSIVDLTVANAVSLATQGGACTTNIRQIYEYGVIYGEQ